ncbi:hypothetical protein QR680_004441 [Steinernema hermaphroditum]|uniref:BTB domain-containing protein n=1 Tax=Steinernema hermaphroditum TaxID=289476 RepID=A0AA39LTP9_9BILA|nr:hypothetical protein QR680_004441 [Steinernema hermaphroditum]
MAENASKLPNLRNLLTTASSSALPPPSPAMTKQKFASEFFKSLIECRNNQILCDVCLRVKAYSPEKATVVEELIYAHRIVLAVASPLFRQMVTSEESTAQNTPPIIDLNLPPLPQSIETFKAMLDYIYSGEINLNSQDTMSMLQIAQLCQVASLESKLLNENLLNNSSVLTRFLQNNPLRPVPTRVAPMPNNPLNMYLQSLGYLENPMMLQMLQPWANPLSGMFFPPNQPMNVETDKTETETSSDRSPAPSGSSPRSPSVPFDNMGDVIVPSNDKEGWCRNKKYIERVPNGFMCTVCRKIYGRYNSVSYHVTIYHRNPPIRCDEEGCSFTTREARYIHFHKYYRHHIPLPQSIDLGSRKCPFCRHVSKSPAMLEKHINRHIPECARVGQQYKCPQCPQTTDTQKEMFDHIMLHQDQETKAPLLSPPNSVKDEESTSDESPIDLTAEAI